MKRIRRMFEDEVRNEVITEEVKVEKTIKYLIDEIRLICYGNENGYLVGSCVV